MPFRFVFAAGIAGLVLLNGCGTSNPILATVGSKQITLSEFEENYAKNNAAKDSATVPSREDRQRYLDLLIKFQLKVQEARARGLDRDSAIQAELETYRSNVAQSYVVDKEIVGPGVRQAYDRRKETLRASHILLRCAPNASPEETLKVYSKAMSIIAQLATVPFDSLARSQSEDQSAKTNSGDIGYFSGGRMVPEFEDACYAMKPGELLRLPVRSQFGYHIIRVTAREPNHGAAHLSHILLRVMDAKTDTAALRDTAWAVFRRLQHGLPFLEGVHRYSTDPASVMKDGDIGFFDRDRLPPALAEGVYRMPADSLIEPFHMPYGFHLVKVMGFRPVPTFEESENEIRSAYQQQRYPHDYQNYMAQLRTKYPVAVDSAVLKQFAVAFDSTKTPGTVGWSDTLTAPLRGKVLMTVGTHPYTVGQVVERIGATTDLHTFTLTPHNVRSLIQKVEEMFIFDEHGQALMQQRPKFAALMKEYEDGVLLYRVEQDEVWQKLPVSDSLQRVYFDAHREEYRWPERVNFAEIYLTKDSLITVCQKKLRAKQPFDTVAATYTARPGYAEKKGVWGLLPVSVNDLADRAMKMAVDSVSAPFKYQNGWSILKTLAKEGARTKTYEEALPEVASAFQEVAAKKREQEWIDGLRTKYPVRIDTELLNAAFVRKADAH